MAREDLLALTPAALASLTNLGLVKRAQKEIAGGLGPALAEEADGMVTGTFPDGAVARLLPGVALRDCECSCGAVGACRHRVAVALAYPDWHAQRPKDGAVVPEARPEWSPGSIDDERLLKALGKRVFEKARALARAGCDVEVRRAEPGGSPAASLPTTMVQFLVPDDLAYARCSCAALQQCEHVALAVWAFRQADARDPTAGVLAVHFSTSEASLAARPLEEAEALANEALIEGIANLTPAVAARLARAQAALDEAGMTWPATIVSDIAQSIEDYRARSARYRPFLAAWLLAELLARLRAARTPAALPAAFVLGQGEARETLLSHVRLVALGARVSGHAEWRSAEIFLADPAAGVVLVLEKSWSFGGGEAPQDGPALAERSVIPGVRLREIAQGDVVTRAAKRLASRALRLTAQRRGSTSVTPQSESWGVLAPPILVADLEELARELRARPPRLLGPRVLAESVRVVRVAEIRDVGYSPGDQALTAVVADGAGRELLLVRRHRSAAPHALPVLAAALRGPVRFVAGEVRLGGGGLEMEPLALLGERLLVPDLAPAPAAAGRLPLDDEERRESPLAGAIRDGWSCVEEGAHQGLLRLGQAWRERVERHAARCEQLGLAKLEKALLGLRAEVRRLQESRTDAGATAVRAWLDAAVRLALSREMLWLASQRG